MLQKKSMTLKVDGQRKTFSLVLDTDKSNHRTVNTYFDRNTLYEPDVSAFMVRCLKENDIFVDIGANLGYFSVLASKLVGEKGKVIAIEPGENNIEDLRKNIKENNINNCEVHTDPLSDQEKDVSFFLNSDDPGGNALWDIGSFPSNVKSLANPQEKIMKSKTLDQVLGQDLHGVRLIKIDAEGAEELILRGSQRSLSQYQIPFVIAELNEYGINKMGGTQHSLRSLMVNAGYDCYVLGTRDRLPYFVPPDVTIRPKYICNLLFCRSTTLLANLFRESFFDHTQF